MLTKIKNIKINFGDIFRRLIFSWLISSLIEYLLVPTNLRNLNGISGFAQMSFVRVITLIVTITLILTFISQYKNTEKIERWGIICAFIGLSLTSLISSFTWPFLVCLIITTIGLIIYGVHGWNDAQELIIKEKKESKIYKWILVGLAAIFFIVVSIWTVGRVYIFETPTYDFGLFAQMFHNMKETGLPMTTLERDIWLSHFAVHVSPIYYILLLFYIIIPKAETLQVLQAAVITSSVIPLWKIGKNHGLTSLQRMLFCTLLLLLPAFSGGVSFDLHENCFLTPLLFWLFYGVDKKNIPVTFISAVLTLMVKEDAAVYVAVIGLWLIIKNLLKTKKKDKQNLIIGVSLLILSIGWFFLATSYLAQNGDGVMTNRYENFMYDGSASLITVIKSIILNPMKTIFECLDTSKLHYIALTILPLLGLPLLTRKYERYILLIPYILVNLMSDYPYQHSLYFQYSFGSIAFLIYLSVINLSDFRKDKKKISALIAATIISALCSVFALGPRIIYPTTQLITNYDHYQDIHKVLDTIPDNASVASTTFYTTSLSNRKILYDISYCSEKHLLESEYVVLQVKNIDYSKYETSTLSGYESLINLLEKNGYKLYNSIDNILVIYNK